MKIKYHTKKGSVYTHQVFDERELWTKEDKDGIVQSLDSAIHITVKSLQKLVINNSSLLDRTYSFDLHIDRDFFENAKKEHISGNAKGEDSLIFFVLKKSPGQYGVGCSSLITQIERED
jgi:hypothetical protein